jgi:hypothetical protein
VIDNVRELEGPQLAKAVTDETMVARVVGSSDAVEIPVMCVWLAIGNNPQFSLRSHISKIVNGLVSEIAMMRSGGNRRVAHRTLVRILEQMATFSPEDFA